MISFELTDEHKMVQDMVRKFAERELAPHIKEWDVLHGGYPRSVLDHMGEQGILGICFPEKYGGGGMDYISLAVACEELERIDTSFRVPLSVHIGLCGLGLLQWGTEEQKQKYLVPLATGEKLGTFGLTEPNAGSDPAALEMQARNVGDHYVLNGEKMWISLADIADTFLVIARTGTRADRARGISAFIIERGMPGFKSDTIHGKMGIRAGNTGSFSLVDTPVPAENLVGEEGEGFKIAMSCLDGGRYTVAAGSVGLIRGCLEASVKYAHERETFGRPIAEHQLVQQMIARMARGYDISRLLVWRAGWLKNQGIRNTRETGLAKWAACDEAFQAATDAVEIHGAYGFSNEYPVERHLRNCKGAVIYEGSAEIQTLLAAGYALGHRQDKPLRRELPSWPFE
ncbi:MAG: acyl-CoA dehydrogenase family protein [Bacillota bacterium]|nr:acyl-CoA dehydrogenase family protein [Bacillota bacterium]